MAEKEYNYEDELHVLRRQNRVLRSANRSLRKRLKRLQEQTDEYFSALCNVDYQPEEEIVLTE